MIVKLSGMQRRAILTYADDLTHLAMSAGSRQSNPGSKWWQVEMPAIAWKRVMDQMRPRLYGPRGGFREATKSLRGALAKVQTELSRLEHHPALTEGALMGWHHEAIPCWRVADRGPITVAYTIYPDIAEYRGEFTILVDHHMTIRGHDITVWAPGEPESGRLTHQESEHLIFHVG